MVLRVYTHTSQYLPPVFEATNGIQDPLPYLKKRVRRSPSSPTRGRPIRTGYAPTAAHTNTRDRFPPQTKNPFFTFSTKVVAFIHATQAAATADATAPAIITIRDIGVEAIDPVDEGEASGPTPVGELVGASVNTGV